MDMRSGFHAQLEAIETDIVRLAAMVTECVARGTDVLAVERHACGAGTHRRRRRPRRAVHRHRGALLPGARAAEPDGHRSAGPRHCAAAHVGARTLRRPDGERREGRSADLRHRLRPSAARAAVPHGRRGATAHAGRDRRLRRTRRRQGGGARRHGRSTRRAPQGVHPGDLRDAQGLRHRPASRVCSSRSSAGTTNESAITR